MPRREEIGDTPFSYAPPPTPQVTQQLQPLDPYTEAMLKVGEAQAVWRQAEQQKPEGTTLHRIEKTPEGYTAYYAPPPQPSWKEGPSVTAQLYRGEWQGLIPELFPQLKREPTFYKIEHKGPAGELAAGMVAPFESWVRPEVVTPMGEAIGRVFGKPTAYEKGEVSPYYLAGGLLGTAVESVLFGKAVGKAWGGTKWVARHVAPETTANIARAAKFGRVSKALYEAKETLKYTEPFYSVRKIPSNITRALAKKFPSEAVKMEAAIPWGQEKFFLPKSFEFWATWKEASKYAGYPVITGKLAQYGVVTVTRPTAYQQIQQAIARGMYPKMGGLSAIQVPVFEKPSRQYGTELIYRGLESTGKKATSLLVPIPMLKPWTWETEKQKFKQVEILSAKPQQRQSVIPVPKVAQPQALVSKQVQRTVPKLVTPIPMIPKITIPDIIIPKFPLGGGVSGGRGARGLYGRWFRKQQAIKTPQQMLQTFFGSPKPRRRRKK